jgi:hypothetical protein
MAILPNIRKALGKVYVIVVTRFTIRVDSLRLEEQANRSSLCIHRSRIGFRMCLRSERDYARRPTPSNR